MQQFNNTRVFISGGAGVIGNALVENLYKMGAKIFVGDLKSRPKHWPSDIVYREGDLNDINRNQLLDFQPEFYFHLAATFERSEESYDFWKDNYHHNIQLSHHLIDILKDSPTLKRIVFASSYLIYDPNQYLFETPQKDGVKLSETSGIFPRNLCGMAKLLHEKELEFIQKFSHNNLKVISARIFRSYGRNSRDIISRWIQALLNNEKITVYCKEGIFDFIFADDVAQGLLSLAQAQESGIVNLGSGSSRKISDVIEILKSHFPKMQMEEKEIPIPYEASQADMTLFQSITGSLPKYKLEQSIPILIEHYRAHKSPG